MKRLLLALVLCVFAVSAAFAQTRYTIPAWKLKLQSRLAERSSLAVQELPLSEVAQILRGALGVNIVLDAQDPSIGDRLITLNVSDMAGDKILGWVTRQAGLDYVLADEAVYIGAPDRTRVIEPRELASYEVSDLVLNTMVSAGSSGSSNSSSSYSSSGNNSSGNNNNSSFTGANAANDLLSLIVLFTGRENWDQVVVASVTDNNDSDNDIASEDNLF